MRADQLTGPSVGQTVLPHKESIDGQRYRRDHRKTSPPGMAGQSTSRAEQAWKQVLASGALQNYHCPRCKTGIVRYLRIRGNLSPVVECDNQDCTWTLSQMTGAERADLASHDPEAMRIAAHVAHITGKERRLRKFLSKCAAEGGRC